jgi:cell division protein FtsN
LKLQKKQRNMKKVIRLFFALSVVALVASGCKTKQKVAQIPAGATIVATTPTTPPVVVNTPAVSEPEVTRNENFSLADGETNSDALRFKYHVVVGSFSKQDNARGLQANLNTEGNRAIVVVNENGMFRVLIASFNEYYQAKERKNQISTRFPDAWVLVKK